MMIGMLASDLMLIYCYSMFAAYKNRQVSGIWAVTYATANESALSLDDISRLDFDPRIYTYAVMQGNGLSADDGGAVFTDKNGAEHPIVGDMGSGYTVQTPVTSFKSGACEYGVYKGRADFEDEYEAILPLTQYTRDLEYDAETDSFGSVVLRGHEFRVIGVSDNNDMYTVIPYETFAALGYAPEYAYFFTDSILPHEQSNALCDTINAAFGCHQSLSRPYSFYEAVEREFVSTAALFFLLYTASMLAFLFYMKYFVSRSLRTYAISHVCGASKTRLISELILQNTALALLCFAAAFGVYMLLSQTGIALLGAAAYEAEDIIVMIVTALAAPFILTVPAIRMIAKMSAVELCRGV